MTLKEMSDEADRIRARMSIAAPTLIAFTGVLESCQTALHLLPTLINTCATQMIAIEALQAEILDLRRQLGIVPPPDHVDPEVLDVLSFEGFQAKTAKSEAMAIPVTP